MVNDSRKREGEHLEVFKPAACDLEGEQEEKVFLTVLPQGSTSVKLGTSFSWFSRCFHFSSVWKSLALSYPSVFTH